MMEAETNAIFLYIMKKVTNSYISKIYEVTVNIFISNSPHRVAAFLFVFKFTHRTMKKHSVKDTCNCFINLMAFNSLQGEKKKE
jgi:hypothetical protein